jgi:hypothetical protein
MPVAIALNIVLGSTVQQTLKLPIYLDSLGTIVTGVLAGPIAGGATGALTDLIWAYVLPPPLSAPTAGPFAITAAVVGILAGVWGRLGLFRSGRSATSNTTWAAVTAVLVVAIAVFFTFSQAYPNPRQLAFSEVIFALVVAVFAALAGWALFVRRDRGAVNAVAVGFVTGTVSALVSAPIAAVVFGGVTGFGGDLVIAALRAAGASLFQAVLTQSLFSDPLDKMITCLLAFLVLAALPTRLVARFPNGERLVPRTG